MQAFLKTPIRSALPTCRQTWPKRLITLKADGYPKDFVFLPDFFSLHEQRLLLSAALDKLDKMESRQYRRRRKEYISGSPMRVSNDVQDVFLPDEYYCFEKVSHRVLTRP